MGGVDMTKIDDAAILQRAKKLCAEAGIAWDRFTARTRRPHPKRWGRTRMFDARSG
jgi:hypothetical protein